MDMELSKRNKLLLEGHNVGLGRDRISYLPNNVLHHILSILPTKNAVASSVLSTNWKYHWTSISNLHFCDGMLCNRAKRSRGPMVRASFMNFVDRVLMHGASSIQKFSLTCTQVYDTSRVNAWISTVLRRNVQELILRLTCLETVLFPRCLFDCESLTTLKINMMCDLTVPTSMCFPHMKVLHLEWVALYSDSSNQQVSFSFPVLDEFTARYICWPKVNIVKISAPSLKRLMILDEGEPLKNCEIQLFAETLVFLQFSSDLVYNYSLCNSSALAFAHINVGTESEDIGHRLIKLFSGICTVKDLTLSDVTIQIFLRHCGETLVHLPTFSSLIHLTVGESDSDRVTTNLMKLLHKMPNLKSLIFGSYAYAWGLEEHQTLEIIPHCIQSNLKFIELYFEGSEKELRLVKYLLKNASVLKEMTFKLSEELSGDQQKHMEVAKKLLKMPRLSAASVINFP